MAVSPSSCSVFDHLEAFGGSGTVLVRKNGVEKVLEHEGRGAGTIFLKNRQGSR